MQSESPSAARFGNAAVFILLTTVCLIPWVHGGNIPLARLILQAGGFTAALLSSVSCMLRNERPAFPPIIFPLGVVVAIGVLQLLPLHAPMASQMNHAVLAEIRHEFIDVKQTELTAGTASPADTRTTLAQLTSLMLLAITAFEQIRTRQTVAASLAVFTANASILSLLGIVQSFQNTLFLIQDQWWTGLGTPFATFINSNNAAGWLTLGLASSIGLLVLQLDTSFAARGHFHDRTPGVFSGAVRYVATLNLQQILVWFSIALITCAVIATRSRGGILATAVSFVVTILARSQKRRLTAILIVVMVGGTLTYSLMVFLSLDQTAALELSTLKDPAGELLVRIQHWRDSLNVVADFPVFGGGLGAYRYTTLPYQTRDAGVWFQHADNQYIEILVDAGIAGGIALLMIGLPTLVLAFCTTRRSIAGRTRGFVSSVGVVLLFATVSQMVTALVDFGAGMPAASSLFVVLVSMLSAMQNPDKQIDFRPSGRILSWAARFALITGTVSFTGDLLAAHKCYLIVIDGRKVESLPLSWNAIEAREKLLNQARLALRHRSDDAQTHELVSRLLSDITRSQFLKGLPELANPEQFQTAWTQTSCLGIARRIDSLRDEPDRQQYLRNVLEMYLDESGIVKHSQRLVSRIPFPGGVFRRTARWEAASTRLDQVNELQARARFIEPTKSKLGLELGELMLRNGRPSKAVSIWQHALNSDESLRYQILSVYSMTNALNDGFENFGPTTYAQAVIALTQSRSLGELTDRLRTQAAEFWNYRQLPPTKEYQQLRAGHLRHLGNLDDRIQWLEQCVHRQPDTIQFHQELATAYFTANRLSDSEDQWYEVLRIDSGNLSAARRIRAIKRKRQQMVKPSFPER